MGTKKFLRVDKVIEQFEKVHGKKYDYSIMEYLKGDKKVSIICPDHGVFYQQPQEHKTGKGCPECGNLKKGQNKLTSEEFIRRVEDVFGKNKFDFSLLKYKDAHTPVSLKCKVCGKIETKAPTVWYKGFGCSVCGKNKKGRRKMSTLEFIKRVNVIHNFKYDYSLTQYFSQQIPIKIICELHGEFEQNPSSHLYGKSGCPHCKVSKGEELIGIWLNSNNLEYKYQYKVKINNSYHYFDFYIPKLNTIIEFNGLQHYKPINFFGGIKSFGILKKRDSEKEQYCLDNQINFIILQYEEMDNINLILETKLKKLLCL
jgi:hypothetical protein